MKIFYKAKFDNFGGNFRIVVKIFDIYLIALTAPEVQLWGTQYGGLHGISVTPCLPHSSVLLTRADISPVSPCTLPDPGLRSREPQVRHSRPPLAKPSAHPGL